MHVIHTHLPVSSFHSQPLVTYEVIFRSGVKVVNYDIGAEPGLVAAFGWIIMPDTDIVQLAQRSEII